MANCLKYTLTNTNSTLVTFNYRSCGSTVWQYEVSLLPGQTKEIYAVAGSYSSNFRNITVTSSPVQTNIIYEVVDCCNPATNAKYISIPSTTTLPINSVITATDNKCYRIVDTSTTATPNLIWNGQIYNDCTSCVSLNPCVQPTPTPNTCTNCDPSFVWTPYSGNTCYRTETGSTTPPNPPIQLSAYTSSQYSSFGTLIYPSYNTDGTLAAGATAISLQTPGLWRNNCRQLNPCPPAGACLTCGPDDPANVGPLSRCGLWATKNQSIAAGIDGFPLRQWLGFSVCLPTTTITKTYYVGVAADNEFRVDLNGRTVVNTAPNYVNDYNCGVCQSYSAPSSISPCYTPPFTFTLLTWPQTPCTPPDKRFFSSSNFGYWNVYPVTIPAGTNNVLSVFGINSSQIGVFGCEIYNNTLQELTAATSYNDLNILFTSSGLTQNDILIDINGQYQQYGYSCPPGYTYEKCTNQCIKYTFCDGSIPPSATPTPTPTPTPTYGCASSVTFDVYVPGLITYSGCCNTFEEIYVNTGTTTITGCTLVNTLRPVLDPQYAAYIGNIQYTTYNCPECNPTPTPTSTPTYTPTPTSTSTPFYLQCCCNPLVIVRPTNPGVQFEVDQVWSDDNDVCWKVLSGQNYTVTSNYTNWIEFTYQGIGSGACVNCCSINQSVCPVPDVLTYLSCCGNSNVIIQPQLSPTYIPYQVGQVYLDQNLTCWNVVGFDGYNETTDSPIIELTLFSGTCSDCLTTFETYSGSACPNVFLTPTPTASITPTPTGTPDVTPTNTQTVTPTKTNLPTTTPTSSVTPTPTKPNNCSSQVSINVDCDTQITYVDCCGVVKGPFLYTFTNQNQGYYTIYDCVQIGSLSGVGCLYRVNYNGTTCSPSCTGATPTQTPTNTPTPTQTKCVSPTPTNTSTPTPTSQCNGIDSLIINATNPGWITYESCCQPYSGRTYITTQQNLILSGSCIKIGSIQPDLLSNNPATILSINYSGSTCSPCITQTPTSTLPPTQTPTNTPSLTPTNTPTNLTKYSTCFQKCCDKSVFILESIPSEYIFTLGNTYYVETNIFSGCVTNVRCVSETPLPRHQYGSLTLYSSCEKCVYIYPCSTPTPTPTNTSTPTKTTTQTPTQTTTNTSPVTNTPTPTKTQTPTQTTTQTPSGHPPRVGQFVDCCNTSFVYTVNSIPSEITLTVGGVYEVGVESFSGCATYVTGYTQFMSTFEYGSLTYVGLDCSGCTITCPTSTPTPTPTNTPTQTQTPTVTPTQTQTPTTSLTPNPTPTNTPSPECIIIGQAYNSSAKPSICANCDTQYNWAVYNSGCCYTILTTGATAPVNSINLERKSDGIYSRYGTRFFSNSFSLVGTGTTDYVISTPYVGGSYTGTLWGNANNDTTSGPLNRTAIWNNGDSITNKWLGFSACLTATSLTSEYYIGIAADNEYKLILDGVEILNTYSGITGQVENFRWWNVYPINISYGVHTLELFGLDEGDPAGFGMEIYNNTLQELTAATSLNDINIIFSSSGYSIADVVQTVGNVPLTSGYTCPSGYVYSSCDGNCTKYELCCS